MLIVDLFNADRFGHTRCPHCDALGWVDAPNGNAETCSICNGKKIVTTHDIVYLIGVLAYIEKARWSTCDCDLHVSHCTRRQISVDDFVCEPHEKDVDEDLFPHRLALPY